MPLGQRRVLERFVEKVVIKPRVPGTKRSVIAEVGMSLRVEVVWRKGREVLLAAHPVVGMQALEDARANCWAMNDAGHRRVVYKVTTPNAKIYVGRDFTGTLAHLIPSARPSSLRRRGPLDQAGRLSLRSTSARGAPSTSMDGSRGASARPPTATLAGPSRSSPTPWRRRRRGTLRQQRDEGVSPREASLSA
jgi:hypothetical protein